MVSSENYRLLIAYNLRITCYRGDRLLLREPFTRPLGTGCWLHKKKGKEKGSTRRRKLNGRCPRDRAAPPDQLTVNQHTHWQIRGKGEMEATGFLSRFIAAEMCRIVLRVCVCFWRGKTLFRCLYHHLLSGFTGHTTPVQSSAQSPVCVRRGTPSREKRTHRQ